MNPPLVFLCHRIPYPPNKGDKIRSYHMLRYLSRYYSIYLGTFIDNQADWKYVPRVEEMCADCCFIKLNPKLASLKSLSGLFTGKPLTVPYYFNKEFADWIGSRAKQHRITRLIAYSSAMAQYVLDGNATFKRKVIDFVDVDSDKWRQYAAKKNWPMSWIYRREADRLLHFEQDVASSFDVSLFVSSSEAKMFRNLIPSISKKIDFYNNGVDTEYFIPKDDYQNPYPDGTKVLVFTGAMDYWPNVDAVHWFSREVLPELLRLKPETKFYIVGSNPADSVYKLKREAGVVVTGKVDDVRPYIRHAMAAVAPMRIARGIQNKVLEAMAMERPVVVSSPGLEGIEAEKETEILLADSKDEFISHIEALFNGKYKNLGKMARQRVKQDFNWEENLPLVRQLLEGRTEPGEMSGVDER